MPRIIHDQYSTYFDTKDRVQFNPVMNKQTGCFVAVAEVDEETAKKFDRAPFRPLSDEEWLAMTSTPKPVEPTAPTTGDPLSDQATNPPVQAKNPPKTSQSAPDLSAPPPPPPSN